MVEKSLTETEQDLKTGKWVKIYGLFEGPHEGVVRNWPTRL